MVYSDDLLTSEGVDKKVALIIFKITKIDGFAGFSLWWERSAAFKEHENCLFAARLPLLCFMISPPCSGAGC